MNASPTVSWRDPAEVAVGPAHRGPWRMNESEFHYVDDGTVALDGEGGAGVMWVDNRRQDAFFQRFDPNGAPLLQRPVNVSRSPGVFSWLPRVVMTEENEVLVLWQEIVFSGGSHGGEIFFARSGDGGRTFEQPVNLSRTQAGAGKGRLTEDRWDNGSLDLVRAPEGDLYAVWTEYEGPLRLARSTDGGRTFTEPMHVSGSADAPARGPSLAVGPEGLVYLAWTVGEDPRADIRFALSEDGARTFQDPEIVSASDQHCDAPKVVIDGRGIIHVVYGERPADGRGPAHLRYLRKRGQAGHFEQPRVLSTDTGPLRGGSASFPEVEVDGAGGVYVLWEHAAQPDQRPQGLGYIVSGDGGGTFTAAAFVPGTDNPALGLNGSLQGQLTSKLAVNEAGYLAVVDSRFRPNEESRVQLILGLAGG